MLLLLSVYKCFEWYLIYVLSVQFKLKVIMSSVQKEKQNSNEFLFLVPHVIIKKLDVILQSSFMKLEKLCDAYRTQYNEKIDFFVTNQNEIVLELQSNYSDNNTSDTEKLPEGWSGLEELIHRIDFSNVLHQDARNIRDRKMYPDEIEKYARVHFFIEFSKGKNGEKVQTIKMFPKCVGNEDIPNFFDKVQWEINGVYTGFVSNIYDPSKFWMKFAEVDLLQKHLYEFYSQKKNDYTLSYCEVSIGLNCAILIDNLYYRGKIVRTDIQDPNGFIVFLYDHGMTYRVNRENLYKLHHKFAVFPAFAVRCALMNVSPLDNESWTQEAVERFDDLTKNDKRLAVKITHIKIKRKILEVYLIDPKTEINRKLPTINHMLVQEKLAKIAWQEPVQSENRIFKRLKNFTYLYPLHEKIENGTAPAQLYLTEKLKKCVHWDVLFPELYKYVG